MTDDAGCGIRCAARVACGLIGAVDTEAARTAIEAVWRLESTRIIAGLVRFVRDLALAEDVAQDALVAALAQWPVSGVPDNPAAWLMTTAKRRAVDTFRVRARGDDAMAALARNLSEVVESDPVSGIDHVEDDVLRLIFICCHPMLTPEAQATLTLKLVGGLSAREIARAYLAPESTIAQRISRAKRTLSETGAALEEPDAAERSARLTTVLGVVYLLFNEGYSATEGEEWMRPSLCDEALRLGRILTTLVPDDAEVRGLSALMELQSSRLAARIDDDGDPVLLDAQDRSQWNGSRIRRGIEGIDVAESLLQPGDAAGPYLLQAKIAACHASAQSAAATDWDRIADLYELLGRSTGSPVSELIGRSRSGARVAQRPGSSCSSSSPRCPRCAVTISCRASAGTSEKLGRADEAAEAFESAAAMTSNAHERALLTRRASTLRSRNV